MILGVNAEQEELRASVRRFLADRAPLTRVRELMDGGETDWAVWEQAGAQLGLQGLAIPEAYGGAGFGFAEQAIVLEEFGAALYGGPYLASAVLAATALLASPDEGARRGLLPDIASGQTVATLAFTEDVGSWDPAAIRMSAVKDGQDWRLDGHKSFVLDGGTAGLILLVAATDAVRLGDGQALQAELGARLLPDGPVGAVLGLHELADPGQRRPVRQEAPDRGPKLFLLRTHTQDHG